ncbi:MAG: hypothetical protein ACREGB_00050 [Candidatus Saccharimonadales bacterium]
MKRSDLYDTITLLSLDGKFTPIGTAKVLKPAIQGHWRRYMTRKERAKYKTLSVIQQLAVSISCDPFLALENYK